MANTKNDADTQNKFRVGDIVRPRKDVLLPWYYTTTCNLWLGAVVGFRENNGNRTMGVTTIQYEDGSPCVDSRYIITVEQQYFEVAE